MKRRNDLYITEYMLQAAMETKMRRKNPLLKIGAIAAVALILVAFAIYIFAVSGT